MNNLNLTDSIILKVFLTTYLNDKFSVSDSFTTYNWKIGLSSVKSYNSIEIGIFCSLWGNGFWIKHKLITAIKAIIDNEM